MKKIFVFVFIILSAFVGIEAQTSRQLYNFHRSIEPIYRKASKEELKAVAPKPELFEEFAGFLRQPNTGLTKLINDTGCSENTKVVVITEDCLKYTMPGAGSSYSFRIENYRIPRLADITFTENSFQVTGKYLHGILVNIGDVPLTEVNLQTAGLQFLRDFQPEIDYAKAKEIDDNLSEGIKQNGFLYRRALYTVENTTFVLRSIAYDGKYFRAVHGITYNELDFDKRKDIIVAFRIVEKDEDGNITILWKILSSKKSPKIKKSRES